MGFSLHHCAGLFYHQRLPLMTAVVLAVLDISEALSRNAVSFDHLIVGFLYNFRLKQFQTHVIQQRQLDKLA
jgi:hypothetical protein